MIKVSDLIFDHLHKQGFTRAFLISGGGIIHLVDSIDSSKIKFTCNHHEQASAVAAEAFSRMRGEGGLCVVTTGPGSTNAITGLIGAWLDSIPVLFISGQIKRETMADYKKLRQLGDQEINIVDMVKPATKYAVTVERPEEILYHLDKALYLSKTGRPGPVWVNIPLDIQGAMIAKKSLIKFSQSEVKTSKPSAGLKEQVSSVLEKLYKAKRPLLMVGNGVRLSGAQKEMLELVRSMGLPVTTGFSSFDLVSSNNPNFAGRPGTIGTRVGNFALQNCDLLLVVGARLNIRILGYNFKAFARGATKIMVDIDQAEIEKKTLAIDIPIVADAKEFIDEALKQVKRRGQKKVSVPQWKKQISKWKERYNPVLPEYWTQKGYANAYCFIDTLSEFLRPHDVLALSNATASICTYQALKFPPGTRVLTNSGSAAMGYGLPAALGAYYAAKKDAKVICIEGDGSMQMNIQELQTIVHNRIPLKIFIYNNEGYVSIRLTQKGLFSGRLVASGNSSGVSCPDFMKIATAYGIKTERIRTNKEIRRKIKRALSMSGPVICQVDLDPNMEFLPKSASKQLPNGSFVSRPLEDMYPFLPPEELQENMLIPLWQE